MFFKPITIIIAEWDPTWTQDRKIQWLENHQDQQDTILNQDVELRNEFFRRHPERADENHRNNQQNNQQNSQWNNQRNDDHHDDRRG
jgi:hypothetical protein